MTSVYSTEYQLVIKILRDARIEKGITQAKLAEALGRPQEESWSFINEKRTCFSEIFLNIF